MNSGTQPNKSVRTRQPTIGLIEDDPIMGESLMQRLELEGYRANWWRTGEEALAQLREASCQVLICDIRLPDLDGEQLFRRALPDLGATPVIFITAFGEVEQADGRGDDDGRYHHESFHAASSPEPGHSLWL